MNITIQKFNAVVEGHNIHRQMLHEQISEQIQEIARLRKAVEEGAEHQARLINQASMLIHRAVDAEEFIRLATQVARGEGVSTVIAVPGGSDLMVEILRLRNGIENTQQALQAEREIVREWQRQAAAAERKRVRRKKA